MKFLFILFIMLLNACTLELNSRYRETGNFAGATGDLTLADKERLYPYFKVNIAAFSIPRATAGADPGKYDPEAQVITIAEKKRVFAELDFLKFVLNSKEYEQEFLYGNSNRPVAEIDMSGDLGSIKENAPFDKQRMLDVMRKSQYNLTLQKSYILDGNATAITGFGLSKPIWVEGFGSTWVTIYPYVSSFNEIKSAKNTITLHNRSPWDVADGYNPTGSLLHHEISHNLNFRHDNYGTAYFDNIYKAVNVFEFREKYKKELKAFRGYHEEKYAHLIQSDSDMPRP